MNWARKRAVDVHDETAGYFSAEYSSDNVYDSPFRYGRSLIDAQWRKVVERLPAGAHCLDIGCGIGAYMARLLEAKLQVRGIEPSPEMRKLAAERLPEGLISDGSVTELPVGDQSQDFIYAIEVFRYLDAEDNVRGHREIVRALKPGGVYFGTYVNGWALDLYRQFVALEKAKDALTKSVPRYHVEFETVGSRRKKLETAGLEAVEIKGAMFAPLRPLHKLSRKGATAISRWTLPRETWLSNSGLSRPFAGHLIAIARRGH
jgi:ubiquinone/menaquinone biosynthesis C-methylase UbiE